MFLGHLTLPLIGTRMARVDRHLLNTAKVRIGAHMLSDAVAEAKRQTGGPVPELTRKDVENQRLAMATTWAARLGIDPDFAASFLYSAIAESCRRQMNFLHDHVDDERANPDDTEAVWNFHRQELLRLTKAVAPTYTTQYSRKFFGTETYLQYEKGELGRLIGHLDQKELAIDLGCATGIKTLRLAENFKHVVGYDISPDMIVQANLQRQTANGVGTRVEFIIADLEEGIPQADNTVSLVLMNLGTGSDIRNLQGLLAETQRVLRPGGVFLFSFYNAESLLAKLGFLPWPAALAAFVDPDKHCLDVHYDGDVFLIYARPYSMADIRKHFQESELIIASESTHPTISSVLPEDILSTETFGGYDGQVTDCRYVEAKLDRIDNAGAKDALRKLDAELARAPLNLGSYIIIVGFKPE